MYNLHSQRNAQSEGTVRILSAIISALLLAIPIIIGQIAPLFH